MDKEKSKIISLDDFYKDHQTIDLKQIEEYRNDIFKAAMHAADIFEENYRNTLEACESKSHEKFVQDKTVNFLFFSLCKILSSFPKKYRGDYILHIKDKLGDLSKINE